MKNIFSGSFHIYKYWHNKNNTFNNLESYNAHVFRSVERGRIVVNCQGKTIIATKGDLLYIPLGRYADIEIFAEPACHGTVLRLFFMPDVDVLGYPPQVIKMDDDFKKLFDDIPIFNKVEEGINSHVIWKVYKFLDAFQKIATKYTDKYSLKIEKALKFMNEKDSYTIAELAEYCEMSERRFRAAFNKILSTSPIEMKHRIQAIKAVNLLKTSELSIQEIANKIGYYSPNQLRNLMQKRYHNLPKNLRKKP